MKNLGGIIIEEEQQQSVRIVKAKFRGFIYTHRFLNYILQAESQKMFREYLLINQESLLHKWDSDNKEEVLNVN